MIWKSSQFVGELVSAHQYGIITKFTSVHSEQQWYLTNIYAPCDPASKPAFIQWFQNLEILDESNWLITGDFNLIRYLDNRNKPGETLWKCYSLMKPSVL